MPDNANVQSTHYQKIIEMANEGIWTLDTDNLTDFINERGAAILGYRPEEMIGRPLTDFIFPESREEGERKFERQRQGIAEHYEFPMRRKDGSAIWVSTSTSPLRGDDGSYQGALAIFSDITERRNAEEAHRASEERLRSTMDNMIEGCRIMGHDRRWLYVNDAAARQAHYSKAEMIGKTPGELFPGIEATELYASMMRCLEGRVPVEAESELTFPDGDKGWFDVRMSPIPEGMFVLSVDITDRRKAEEALRDSEERFAKLFYSSPVAMSITEHGTGRYIDVNDAWLEKVKRRREEAIGRNAVELGIISPEQYAQANDLIARREFDHFQEVVVKDKDGAEWTYLMWVSHLNIKGKKIELSTDLDITEIKRAKQKAEDEARLAHRRAEELQAIMDAVPAAIWVATDPECKVIIGNKMADSFYESKSEENVSAGSSSGEEWDKTRRFFREDHEQRPDQLPMQESARTGKEVRDVELEVLLPSGQRKTMLGNARPLFDEKGKVRGSVASFLDITYRKRTEEALKESEERFHQVLENSLDVIYRFNLQTSRYEYMSPAIRALGFEPEEMISMTNAEVFSRVHPDDLPGLRAELAKIAETGRGASVYRFKGKDGVYRWWSNHLVITYDENGKPLYRDGYVRDITKRKQMEDELQATNARLETILQQLPIGLSIVEAPSGKTVYANEQVGKILRLGFEPTYKIAGPSDYPKIGVYHLDGRPYEPEEFSAYKALQYGTVTINDVAKVRRGDGTWGYVSGSSAPIMDQQGNIIAAVAMIIDVSDSMELQNERDRLVMELKRSNIELRQFAYVASHDLQEPLRMVSTHLSLLSNKYGSTLDARAKEHIRYAVEGSLRMKTLVDDLLDYTRVDTGGKPFVPVDMNDMVRQTLSNLKTAIAEGHAIIKVDLLPVVLADSGQIVSLLQNLIGNAIKFRSDAPPIIEVSSSESPREYTFSVRDNGIGINPEYSEKIFEVFQRLHTNDKYPGTGIGLAIVKKIVERHGGRVWVESEEGHGSTFFFTIPKRWEE